MNIFPFLKKADRPSDEAQDCVDRIVELLGRFKLRRDFTRNQYKKVQMAGGLLYNIPYKQGDSEGYIEFTHFFSTASIKVVKYYKRGEEEKAEDLIGKFQCPSYTGWQNNIISWLERFLHSKKDLL